MSHNGVDVNKNRRKAPTRSFVLSRTQNWTTCGSADHGVGHYQNNIDANVTTEFVTIEYAQQSKLYVPVASLDVLSRYAEENHAPHKLGNSWGKPKTAAEKIRDVATELLDVYAKRASNEGYGFTGCRRYQRFADSFPFEETTDQLNAINAVVTVAAPTRWTVWFVAM